MVALFRLLQAKEVFVKSFIEFLADRLLKQVSVGGYAREQEIITLFKEECGD